MKIQKLKQIYERQNRRVSDINRLLIFVGIAITWLFNITSIGKGIILPNELHPVLILLIFSMIADILQYLSRYICYRSFYLIHLDCDDVKERKSMLTLMWLDFFPQTFCGTKVVLTLEAYIYFVLRLCVQNTCCCWKSQVVILITWCVVFAILLFVKILFSICVYAKKREQKQENQKQEGQKKHKHEWLKVLISIGICVVFMAIAGIGIYVVTTLFMRPNCKYCCRAKSVEYYERHKIKVDTIMESVCDSTLFIKILEKQDITIELLQSQIEKSKVSSTSKSYRPKKKIGYVPIDTMDCDGVKTILVKEVKY